MKTTKRLVSFICFFLALMNYGCNQQGKQSIKIGAILPLTGNSAVWGVPTKEGVELAADIINKNGGINGKKIEMIFEDTKGDPTTGVSAAQKLINVDNVLALIDNSNSSVTLAVAPIVEKSKVPLLVTGASSPKIKYAGDYVFRIWNSDDLEGELMASYSFDTLKYKKVAIIYVNNNYGMGLKDVFQKSLGQKGGIVCDIETFNEDASDFRIQSKKVIASNCDAIYIVCYPKQGAILLKQLKELGNTKQLLGAVAFEDPDLIKLAGNAANGLIYPLPAPVDSTLSYYHNFKTAYIKNFNKQVPFLAPEGFDGLNVLAEAIKKQTNISREGIKDSLYKIQNYKGVSGLISFNSYGEVHKPFGMRKVENDSISWIYK